MLAVICLVLFLCLPFSFHQVDAGEIAVVKHMGQISNVRTAGTYFDFWMTEKYERYDAKVQNMDIEAQAYSSDGQTMEISITVQYSIDQAKVKEIATQYGNLDALANKVEKVAVERTKATLSKQQAMTIIQNRASISPEVEATVKAAVDESFYITINTVVLTNIDFTDQFESTVEQKMIAEQQKLQAQYENEKIIAKAETDLKVAQEQAKARIAAAEADAQSRLLVAQAEAGALKAKSIEVARMLGLNILVDEDGVETVEFKDGDEEKAKLISEYLKYIEYLNKWDGVLPDVVGGSATGYMPISPDNTEAKS